MEEFIPIAPSHNPPYINAIKNIKQLLPGKPLVGLFEPAFHKTIPEYAYCYGLPYEWIEKYGIRKYGFHGASLRYVSERVIKILGKNNLKQIICHLGGSSSICAVKRGKSIDTSMGFSPQSGIPHSTRPGDLDPFVVLYLMKKENLTVDDVIKKLSEESGLLGISGVSGEMKDIVESTKNANKRALLAIDTFVYNVKKYIGSYIAILEGLDVLAFTGGIGERSDLIREKICSGLEFLGIKIDAEKNKNVSKEIKEIDISSRESKVKILIVPTNEEIIVARATVDVVRKNL
jgi:acetate kinase